MAEHGRLIDGDALKAVFRKEYKVSFADAIDEVIDAQPTVEERKKGKWNRRIVDSGYNADWVCSECKYTEKRDFPTKYCPNCGADMRETGWMK